MAINKDYANKKKMSSKRRAKVTIKGNGRTSVRNFSSIFILVLVVGGLFAAAVFYLEYFRNISIKPQKIQHVEAKQTKKQDVVVAAKKQPKFEFYYTLPKMEVAVSKFDSGITPKLAQPISKAIEVSSLDNNILTQINSPNIKPASPDASAYVLQIASFKEIKDANELRAKLILIGFDILVQSVQLDSGETWHRVKTSKVSTISKAEQLSSQLQAHNIKSIILTEKSYG